MIVTVILVVILVTVAVLVLLLLHTFFYLFLFHIFSEHFEKVDDCHIFVCRLLQRILYPFVGFAADVYEQIAH